MPRPLSLLSSLILLSTFLSGLPSAVHAQGLVQNPGFETGSFPPWTARSSGSVTVLDYNNAGAAHSGTYSGIFITSSSSPGTGTLTQTLNTVAGRQYTLDFWLQDANLDNAFGTDSFTVSWNNNALPTLSTPSDFTYHEYTFTVTATGSSTALTFLSPTMSADSAWIFFLDDVKVVGVTPAPSALLTALLGASPGLGLVCRRLRRRREPLPAAVDNRTNFC